MPNMNPPDRPITKDRDFSGVWFPRDLYLNREMNFQDKAMLVEIYMLAILNPARGCFASNRHFAEFFDLSISRVSEIISKLVKLGFLNAEMVRSGREVVERRLFATTKAAGLWAGATISEYRTPMPESAANLCGFSDRTHSENAQEKDTNKNTIEGKESINARDLFDELAEITAKPEPAPTMAEEFETFWKLYPRKVGKENARKAYIKARAKAKQSAVLTGLHDARKVWETRQTALEYIPHAATWLNQARFSDDLTGEINDASHHPNQSAGFGRTGSQTGGPRSAGGNQAFSGWSSMLSRNRVETPIPQDDGATIIVGKFTAKS